MRVCGIAPGPIGDTEGMRRLAPTPGANDQLAAEGFLGEKDDIAFAAVFLASAAAKFISGETLVVDGGAWLMPRTLLPRDVYETQIKPARAKL